MKLFAFVRRARRPPPTSDPAPVVPAGGAAQEDAGAGGAPSSETEKRRRRPSSSSSSAWKPTLVAISEDAAAMTSVVAQANKPARKAKPLPVMRPSPRAARTTSYDDFRYSGPPVVLPAFTPTAFLF